MDLKTAAIGNALKQWWEARAEREQRLLALVGAIAGAAVIYSALWAPAFDGVGRIDASLPALQTGLADARVQAEEARRLRASSAVAGPSGAALRDAIKASLDKAAPGQVQLTLIDKAVQIDAKDVSFGEWIAWLDDARKQFHVRVTNARVNANDKPGHTAVSVTLQPADAQ